MWFKDILAVVKDLLWDDVSAVIVAVLTIVIVYMALHGPEDKDVVLMAVGGLLALARGRANNGSNGKIPPAEEKKP